MKLFRITFALLLTVGILNAQEQETELPNTLEGQFTDVIENSNRYQDYKVVKIYKLNDLKKSVFDSIAALEAEIDSSQTTITKQDSQINTLSQDLKTTQEDLTLSKKREDGISFLGALLPKATYNGIMWTIILVLIAGVAFLVYKFKSSHRDTRAAQLKLAETEEEFETHRQRTLEREQQLRRKLQDEINKQKKG